MPPRLSRATAAEKSHTTCVVSAGHAAAVHAHRGTVRFNLDLRESESRCPIQWRTGTGRAGSQCLASQPLCELARKVRRHCGRESQGVFARDIRHEWEFTSANRVTLRQEAAHQPINQSIGKNEKTTAARILQVGRAGSLRLPSEPGWSRGYLPLLLLDLKSCGVSDTEYYTRVHLSP
jgi:hypothetical protein